MGFRRSALHRLVSLAGRCSRSALTIAALSVAGLVAGCSGSSLGDFPGYPSDPNAGNAPVAGDVIGTGTVRVGLLLPLSGGGNQTSIGQVFRNSAELALSDFQGADIQLIVKDTGGTAEGGRMAAQEVIAQGAELILGPVFAPAVGGAGSVARSSGVPVVAFSTDTAVASRGVYLLSFLPESDVRRIVSFAGSQGKRSFAAILPDDAYGSIAEAVFRQEVGRAGGRIVSIQRYSLSGGNTDDLRAKAETIAASSSSIDTLFVPAGGGVPGFVAQVLQAGGNFGTIKMIGTGQWDSAEVQNTGLLTGAWYPGPDNSGFQSFAQRYQGQFGSRPPRNATLAYDATILAAGLVRSAGAERFNSRVMTNSDGFLGIDGVFRFRSNGLNERGLAVYEVTGSGTRVIDAAPRSFGPGS
ncbi:ABC transporter substrate-binding protein [Stappia sp. GBMRC 2046]|uniref:ABC transporter substrate-binding protein n=1 Tax=Stappia sediminis TaxID=2692190 RepID=A0A7X3LTH3_9HYPH|nr:ABC transporter substrate-binding protein [Stappia sediminis]